MPSRPGQISSRGARARTRRPATRRTYTGSARRSRARGDRRRLGNTGAANERVSRHTAARGASNSRAVALRARRPQARRRREVASVGGARLRLVVRVESDVKHLGGIAHREFAVHAGGAVAANGSTVRRDTADDANGGTDFRDVRDDAWIVHTAELADNTRAEIAVGSGRKDGGRGPGRISRRTRGRRGHSGRVRRERRVCRRDRGCGRGKRGLVVGEVGARGVGATVGGDVAETEIVRFVDEFLLGVA